MKLLLDQNISYKLIKSLQGYFAEVNQIGRLGMAQTEDSMIWQYARINDFIMVTFDAYFQERNLISGNPIKVIWLKLQNTSTEHIAKTLIAHTHTIEQFSTTEHLTCLELYD